MTGAQDAVDGAFDKLWWLLGLRGLGGLSLAVIAFIWPILTLESLLFGFALYVAFDGALAVLAGLESPEGRRFWPFFVEGALGLLFAGALTAWPDRMAFSFSYLVAGWAISTGVFELVAAVHLRRIALGETLLLRAAMASIVFGVVIAIWPRPAILALAWLVGLYSAVFGTFMLFLAARLRQLGGLGRPVARDRP